MIREIGEIVIFWMKLSSTSFSKMPLLSRGLSWCLVAVLYGLLNGFSLFGVYSCTESRDDGISVDYTNLSSQPLPIPLHGLLVK
jgi:hypothetical protein